MGPPGPRAERRGPSWVMQPVRHVCPTWSISRKCQGLGQIKQIRPSGRSDAHRDDINFWWIDSALVPHLRAATLPACVWRGSAVDLFDLPLNSLGARNSLNVAAGFGRRERGICHQKWRSAWRTRGLKIYHVGATTWGSNSECVLGEDIWIQQTLLHNAA